MKVCPKCGSIFYGWCVHWQANRCRRLKCLYIEEKTQAKTQEAR